MSAAKSVDDLDALRMVIEAVKGFGPDDQQRIFRWAAEKLALPQPFGPAAARAAHVHQAITPTPTPPVHLSASVLPTGTTAKDIKSFVSAKNPRSDVQFAATVAFYFQFEAPQSERKDSITRDDLQDACRKSGRDRLKNPGQTLRNAHHLGLLDKAAETGHFSVNTVGENLVAMTLPGDPASSAKSARRAVKNAAKSSALKKKAKKPVLKKAKKA